MIAQLVLILMIQSQPVGMIDSLKSELPGSSDSLRHILYVYISWQYTFSDADSAVYYAEQAIALGEANGQPEKAAMGKSMLALAYEEQGRTALATELYLELIDFFEATGNTLELSTVYNNLGILFFNAGDLDKAADLYQKSLDIDNLDGNGLGVIESLTILATISGRKSNYPEALDYLEKAQVVFGRFTPEYVAKAPDDIREAVVEELKRLEILIYEGFAKYYLDVGVYDSSVVYFNRVLPLFGKAGKTSKVLESYNGLIEIYYTTNMYDSAVYWLVEAEQVANDYDHLATSKQRSELGAQLYAAMGNYQKAYAYQQQYQQSYDSLNSLERVKVASQLEEKYQADKRESEIALLEIQKEKSENQRNTLFLIAILVTLLVVVLWVLFRSKAKSNRIITNSLAEKETLLKEIHHRVKNNLQVISSLLRMQSRFIKDKDAIGAVNEGQSRVESMALIHQMLYQENTLAGVKVKEYVEELTNTLKASYSIETNVSFDYWVDDIIIDIDTVIPIGLILNELVCNSLKYAFPSREEGLISIRLVQEEGKLILEIRDDGIGSKSTPSEDSFGMILVSDLARKLDATVEVNAVEGTVVTVAIQKFKLI